jgi:hypothetical protein
MNTKEGSDQPLEKRKRKPGHKFDILYFANMVWNHFQRPHSLLVEFAKRGHRAFYVEPMLSLGSVVNNAHSTQQLICAI